MSGKVAAIALGIGLGTPLAFLLYQKRPPPKRIMDVISNITIVRTYGDVSILNPQFKFRPRANVYVFNWKTPPDVQYPSATEVFTTLTARDGEVAVEVSKNAWAKIDTYYAGQLLTTFPAVTALNQTTLGYYDFHVTAYNKEDVK